MFKAKKTILVVDDEANLVEVVKSYLENSGYSVFSAYNGEEALRLFDKVNPSLVVLDLMLPDIQGEEVCYTIRRMSRVPIIMLTAKSGEEDILNCLNMGADDYVTKPFSPRQLVARVAAMLRRAEAEPVPIPNMISFNNGDLVINDMNYEVKKAGCSINLTRLEYQVLMTLVRHPDKVLTRDELIGIVMGSDFNGYDRAIDSHIKNLRQKIENDIKKPEYILTVYGVGYRFGGI
jgi:DNA-binding response OmpR family regulator